MLKSYEQLTEYKLYNKADMIALAMVILNQYGINDKKYNQIIRIMCSGRNDIYSSDLISCVHEYAKMPDRELQEFYDGFVVERRRVWYMRQAFWYMVSATNKSCR